MDETVQITLIDFSLSINDLITPVVHHQDEITKTRTLIGWLKTKMMNRTRCFSMNFNHIQSIEYKTLTNHDREEVCDLKISYLLDCLLVCTERVICLLDRTSKRLIRTIELEFNYVNSLINDDYGEIYLLLSNDYSTVLRKYGLSAFLFGEKPVCLWEREVGELNWGIVWYLLDNEPVVITSIHTEHVGTKFIRCGDGEIMDQGNLPKTVNCSAVEVTPGKELIYAHSKDKLHTYKKIGDQWVLMNETCLSDCLGFSTSFDFYTMFCEKISGNIYLTLPFTSMDNLIVITQKSHDIQDGWKLVHKMKFEEKTTGACIDYKSGQLLVAQLQKIAIFE